MPTLTLRLPGPEVRTAPGQRSIMVPVCRRHGWAENLPEEA